MNIEKFYIDTKKRLEEIDFLNCSEANIHWLAQFERDELWPTDDYADTHLYEFSELTTLFINKQPAWDEVKEVILNHLEIDEINRLVSRVVPPQTTAIAESGLVLSHMQVLANEEWMESWKSNLKMHENPLSG